MAVAAAGGRQRRRKSGSSIEVESRIGGPALAVQRRFIKSGSPSTPPRESLTRKFLLLEEGFAKGPGAGTDLSIPDPMKFLVSRMADLKLQLLDTLVHRHVADTRSNPRNTPDRMIVCGAVEDRISHHVDLTSRADLTDQQVMDALRLLLKIVRRNGLAVDFSRTEISFLMHRISQNSSEEGDHSLQESSGPFSARSGRSFSAAHGSARHARRSSP
jgi:hypothetical protein